MKTLFLSVYMHTPHFETELEIISDLMEAGHDVKVVRCTGQLDACELNENHLEHICVFCRSKFNRGMEKIGMPAGNIIVLPPMDLDYGVLPEMFDNAADLRAFTLDGVNLGLGVASSLITRINRDPNFDTRAHAETIRRELKTALYVYKAMSALVDLHKPDEVYVFNGRFCTYFPVLLICEQRGITYYTHDRGGRISNYLLRKNCLPHDIIQATKEIIELWKKSPSSKEEEAASWYHDRRNGVEQSWIVFSKDQTKGLLPDSFDASKRNIVVFSSTLEETAVVPGWENRIFKDELEALRRTFDHFHGEKNIKFYLRMHPNMKGIPRAENFQLSEVAMMERKYPNVEVIWPESVIHSYALMEKCEMVLTFGSTTGVEACFYGSPSILAGASFYESLDCAYVPGSPEELFRMLGSKLPPKDKHGALMYAYWEIYKGLPYRKFKPSGLFGGEFLGERIRPGLPAKAYSFALQLARVRSVGQLAALMKVKSAKIRATILGK
ncbi:MAG: hypothetical protein M3Y08_08470 [Fibrobacterota bacterium]|nr:hypothetical protein [Fibrobacterota bacterium]